MKNEGNVITYTFLGQKQQKKQTNIPNVKKDTAKQSTGFAKEKARLNSLIKIFAEENDKLSLELDLMDGAMQSQADRDRIFKEFESDFNKQIERLEKRKAKLLELEKLVCSFRCVEEDIELSLTKPTAEKDINPELLSSRKQAPTASTLMAGATMPKSTAKGPPNQMKRPESAFIQFRQTSVKYPQLEKYTIVPPPQSLLVTSSTPKTPSQAPQRQKLIPSSRVLKKFQSSVENPKKNEKKQTETVRTDLVEEHERLVAISLYLERLMLVQKMKLRLCHDHRDLSSLRVSLNSLEGGGKNDDDEKVIESTYKIKISNLRAQIQREKARLKAVTQKPSKRERAAISIQSLIRGHLCRLQYREYLRMNRGIIIQPATE